MRLNAYLARAGVASRRKADELIKAGRVRVNGEPGELNTFVGAGDTRRGRRAAGRRSSGSPTSCCTSRRGRHDGARPARPADGGRPRPARVARRPGRPARRRHDRSAPAHERRRARAPARAPALRGGQGLRGRRRGRARRRGAAPARRGVELDDGRTAPAHARRLGAGRVELTIHEGRKHQVKRMCEAVGHPVRRLHRSRYAGLDLARPAARPVAGADARRGRARCAARGYSRT